MWNNGDMDTVKVRHYIDRAADFYAGQDLMRNDELFRNSSALLAIHSAISYSDALRVGLGDEALYADDHRQALAALRELLLTRGLPDMTGFAHFEYLISMKSFVSYGERRLDANRQRLIAMRAERFVNWVSEIARRLRLEGWTNDD